MLLLLYLVDICSSVHTCIICCVDVPSLGWTAFSEEVVVMDSPIGCVFFVHYGGVLLCVSHVDIDN